MTVSFSHLDPGFAPEHWDELIAGLPDLTTPVGPGRALVVLAAHPDDETLGAGGLIATVGAAGGDITVIVASDGEGSHPDSPTHRPAELAARRRAELTEAVRTLAPRARIQRLGLPDGHLDEHRAAIAAAVDDAAAVGAMLVTPWWGDGHPDHTACAMAAGSTQTAATAPWWQYPIWSWHWGGSLPADRGTVGKLVLTPELAERKARAIDCYPSQHQALSGSPGDEVLLPPAVLAHFRRGVEVFVTAAASRPDYFERLYELDPDPWALSDRFYERRKRDLLMASLPRPRFRRAFEPGCAIGLLTRELAGRTDRLIAYDPVPTAVEQARHRVRASDHVTIERAAIPGDWPDGSFDLIVLSEIGYYCPDLELLVDRVNSSLTRDGVVVGCHWRRDAPLHPHSAEEVHRAIGRGRGRIVTHVEDDFVLEVWTGDGRSVAQCEGIVE
jgi:LmbE family N-acetylglucosaminyl deacetylase